MITEKARISRDFPISVKFFFQKRNWYLFPQGFTCKEGVTKLKYDTNKSEAKNDVYLHKNFMIVNQYHFTWLFMHFVFNTKLFFVSEQHFSHKRFIDLSDRKVIFDETNKN